MLLSIVESLLLAASLCADCFAVSTCSSVTLEDISWRKILPIALAFGVVQTALMAMGWLFGDIFVGHIHKVASLIGFLLLLYVGGSMILGAVKNEDESRDLNGLKNVIIGAVATSIDALSVGFTIAEYGWLMALTASGIIAVVTFFLCMAGLRIGKKFGTKLSGKASVLGGIILIGIGLEIFLSGVFF